MMNKNIFSQSGWPFVPVIEGDGSRLKDISYHEDIFESLHILFTTLPGERIAHPLYGCDLMKFMFKAISKSLLTHMENTIRTSIVLYESRIIIEDLNVTVNELVSYRLDINISYILSKTNSRYNMTIPFYTMEAGVE